MNTRVLREAQHFGSLRHVWWGTTTCAGQRRYDNKAKLMKNMCRIINGAKILEIGCGDGEFTKRLINVKAKVIATDVTDKLLMRGSKKIGAGNIKFLKADAENLNFKSESFDIVCGVSILHHVDTKKALREAYRVLKGGGQIFFTEPNLLNPNIFFGLHIPLLRVRMEFSDDETALIRWQVESMLKTCGFKKIAVRNYDFLHPLTPKVLIKSVEVFGRILEKTPLVKEISGSLLIWARK